MQLTNTSKTKNEAASPSGWIAINNFVNELQQPIEFKQHKFLIKPFSDLSPDIVVKKSAQVGFSVTAILKSIWCCKYIGLNVIYALPTNDIIKGFVQPKVDTLIGGNYEMAKLITIDSLSLKQIGNRFLHFKGTGSQREAISTSADLLVVDEYDRALSMEVVNTFDSRLQYSKYAWRWRFSNPSGIGFGVDYLYTDSDQMHWFIKCPNCNHERYIDFEASEQVNHYIDQELKQYVCGRCHNILSDDDRRDGRWVAKYPTRKRRGYWISQLMAPWVSAEKILEQKEESSIDFFYNFVLGKAYTPSDLIVNRETILRACAPSNIPKVNVVMGVDQNATEQIWVAATPQGIFAHGKTESWEELERLKLMWNAIVVMDPAPYPTMPKKLVDKYPDMYLCYFHEQDGTKIVTPKAGQQQVLYADRTRLLDTVANEITSAALMFREKPYELEDYIADWQNLYRTTKEELDGRSRSVWLKKDNKESDYSLATAYMRVALSFIVDMSSSNFIEPTIISDTPISDEITDLQQTSLSGIVEETLSEFDE